VDQIKIHDKSSLEFMYAAGRIAACALDKVEFFLNQNKYIQTKDIDKLCREYIIAEGGIPACVGYQAFGAPPYQYTTCISINDVACHGLPSDYVLAAGDILNVDLVVDYQGWLGDTSRTFIFGGSANQIRTDLVKHAQTAMYKGAQVAKLGQNFSVIGAAIEDFCKSVHAGSYTVTPLRDYCGHGISNQMHEAPLVEHVRNSCETRIQPYLYFTIEPILIVGNDTRTYLQNDRWTVKTVSKRDTAQFEHTFGLDEDGVLRIFTTRDKAHEELVRKEIYSA